MISSIVSSKIVVETVDPENLKKLLEIETKRKEYKRSDSKIVIDSEKKELIIEIFAEDLIAFKATINNYINLLELISKTYEVKL